MIVDANASDAVAIWEAKIKLAEDLENLVSWNVAGWRKALAKLSGKHVTATQDPTSKPIEGEKKKDATDDDQDKV